MRTATAPNDTKDSAAATLIRGPGSSPQRRRTTSLPSQKHVSFALERNQCLFFTPPAVRRRHHHKHHSHQQHQQQPTLTHVGKKFDGTGWTAPEEPRAAEGAAPGSPVSPRAAARKASKRKAGAGSVELTPEKPEERPLAPDSGLAPSDEGEPPARVVEMTQTTTHVLIRVELPRRAGVPVGIVQPFQCLVHGTLSASGACLAGVLLAREVSAAAAVTAVEADGRTLNITVPKTHKAPWKTVGQVMAPARAELALGSLRARRSLSFASPEERGKARQAKDAKEDDNDDDDDDDDDDDKAKTNGKGDDEEEEEEEEDDNDEDDDDEDGALRSVQQQKQQPVMSVAWLSLLGLLLAVALFVIHSSATGLPLA